MKFVAKRFTEIPEMSRGKKSGEITKREREIIEWVTLATDGDCLEVETWKQNYKSINGASAGIKNSGVLMAKSTMSR